MDITVACPAAVAAAASVPICPCGTSAYIRATRAAAFGENAAKHHVYQVTEVIFTGITSSYAFRLAG